MRHRVRKREVKELKRIIRYGSGTSSFCGLALCWGVCVKSAKKCRTITNNLRKVNAYIEIQGYFLSAVNTSKTLHPRFVSSKYRVFRCWNLLHAYYNQIVVWASVELRKQNVDCSTYFFLFQFKYISTFKWKNMRQVRAGWHSFLFKLHRIIVQQIHFHRTKQKITVFIQLGVRAKSKWCSKSY